MESERGEPIERDGIGPGVAEYVDALPPDQRRLFERIHRLILDACPAAEVVISYKMPTFRLGKRRLHVAGWSHGLSIYGWKASGDGGFIERHPELRTSTGTIQLRTDRAEEVADDEIRALARAVLTA